MGSAALSPSSNSQHLALGGPGCQAWRGPPAGNRSECLCHAKPSSAPRIPPLPRAALCPLSCDVAGAAPPWGIGSPPGVPRSGEIALPGVLCFWWALPQFPDPDLGSPSGDTATTQQPCPVSSHQGLYNPVKAAWMPGTCWELSPGLAARPSLYLGLAQKVHRLQVLQVPLAGPEDLAPGDLPRLQGGLFLEGGWHNTGLSIQPGLRLQEPMTEGP